MLPDPFTRSYQAILAALRAWPGFTELVRDGNVIDMTAPQVTQNLKPQVQDADTPEVALMQGGFELRPFGNNSRELQIIQSYDLMITAANLNLAPLNSLKYQALLALLKAGPTLGLDCVRGYHVSAATDSPSGKPQWTRDTRRWFTALSINVEMYLDRTLLTAQTATP